MKIIHDPDYWYEPTSTSNSIAVDEEGNEAYVLDRLPIEEIRTLRDTVDIGEVNRKLVIRDRNQLEVDWPGLAARAIFETAPRTVDYFESLSAVLAEAKFEAHFADVRKLRSEIDDVATTSNEMLVEMLNLMCAVRSGREYYPKPSLLDEYPETVRELLEVPEAIPVEAYVVRRLLDDYTFRTVLESPGDGIERYRVWAEKLDWVTNQQVTASGEQAIVFIEADRETKTEWEAWALLERATETTPFRVETKLQKAALELESVDTTEELDSELAVILSATASKEAYNLAQELAAEQRVLDPVEQIDVDENTIHRYIEKSRPQKLREKLLLQIEQIPFVLYQSLPTDDIEVIVSALEAENVVTSLDTAIAEDAAEIDKTIEIIEEVIDVLEPVITQSQVLAVTEVIEDARKMMAALNPSTPSSAQECVELYEEQIERESSLSTDFSQTEPELADTILAECEDYIRETYRTWAHEDPDSRDVSMITDIPDQISSLLSDHNHILLIVSDGFGLRQWLDARQTNETLTRWDKEDIITNELMTTVFPSETGTGHYSLFTGEFPSSHGRDDIRTDLQPNDTNLFAQAKEQNAFTQALSYLPAGSGFSTVLDETAHEFHHLEGLRAEDAALQKETVQHVRDAVNNHSKSVSLLQHNQIDQLHEGTDHIADALIPGVADDLIRFVQLLAENTPDVLPILTADHGMIRTRDTRRSLISGEALNALKGMNERYDGDALGQRVAGLQSKSGSQQYQSNENYMFEILSKQDMQELRASTEQKFDGRCLRFKRRYYSEKEDMTATHGAFTFDEMFIPFATFDLEAIAESDQ